MNSAVRDLDPVTQLTAGQRDCLRLVAQLQSSKQIARRLGISNHTVDQRIARACRSLGAASRADAALMVARFEAGAAISDQVGLVSDPHVRAAFPQLESANVDEEPQVASGMSVDAPGSSAARLPFPTATVRLNDMPFLRRLAWAVVVFAGSIVVAGVILTSLAALRQLLE